MKTKASVFVKTIISTLSSTVKQKFTGVKGKADAIRIRLLFFSLIKNRRFSFTALSNKIQTLLDKKQDQLKDTEENPEENNYKAVILYDTNLGNYDTNDDEFQLSEKRALLEYYGQDGYYEDGEYPDLTHSLFDKEGNNNEEKGSVIDLVKNSKENEGQDFKLEDEIDHVADLFIKRFKRQMLLQKLESFKRLQVMLGTSTY